MEEFNVDSKAEYKALVEVEVVFPPNTHVSDCFSSFT